MTDRFSSTDEWEARREEVLEARYCVARLAELQLSPVRGRFDEAHVWEINRRIFQDMPAAGFAEVTPGQFRAATPPGLDHLKMRVLSESGQHYVVAYSAMHDAATARMQKALGAA